MKNGWYLNPLAGPGSAHSSKLRPGASNPPPAASSSSSAIRTAGKSGASSGMRSTTATAFPRTGECF